VPWLYFRKFYLLTKMRKYGIKAICNVCYYSGGFLSELLGCDLIILEILESESNKNLKGENMKNIWRICAIKKACLTRLIILVILAE
jgi:hypothetical protein